MNTKHRLITLDIINNDLGYLWYALIERDPNSPVLDELRELGANVMIADATLRRNIERACWERASEIFVVTGSGEANLDITADVIELCNEKKTITQVPRVHVHLHQMRLDRVIADSIGNLRAHETSNSEQEAESIQKVRIAKFKSSLSQNISFFNHPPYELGIAVRHQPWHFLLLCP